MPKIIYCTSGGDEYEVEARAGTTVMEAAVRHAVPGIEGDCGGACACATCHVYVPDEWTPRLQAQTSIESSMLEFADGVRPNSRLGCQIRITETLDGLRLQLPAGQP